MEELLIKVDVQGQTDVDKVDKGIEKVGKTAIKTESELTKLRKEIKQGKTDMLTAAEGTEAYNRALAKTSAAQFKLKDINDKTRAAVQDFGQTSKNIATSVAGLAGGFSVVTGAMALFGSENDAVAQALLKVQSAMAVATGIGQFADSIDSMKDLFAGLKASGQAASGVVNEISNVSKDAAGNMSNLAKETAVVTSNLAGGATVATTAINNTSKSLDEWEEKTISLQNAWKKGVITSDEYIKKGAELDDTYLNLADSSEKAGEATEKTTSSVGKQMLMMGVWVIAITAVIIVISKLIEWMNKIPESTKVQIDVNTDVYQALIKDQVKIKTFLNDYNKAIKDVNKERIKELEIYAKKEFDLTDESLKKYKDDNLKKIDSTKELFKKYLKIAEDTYWNESIIKRKVDAKQAGETAIMKAQKLFLSVSKTGNFKGKTEYLKSGLKSYTWEDLVKKAQSSSNWEVDFQTIGIPQQIVDELRAVLLSNEIIKNLPKLRDVDMGTGKPTGGGGGSTNIKTSLNMDSGLNKMLKPTLTKGDNFYKPMLDQTIKYTEEELIIIEDNNKKRSKLYNDDVEYTINTAIRKEKARKNDLENQLAYQYGQKMLLQDDIERFDDIKKLYNSEILELNDYEKNKTNYQNLIIASDNELKSLGDKVTQADVTRINKKKQLYSDEIALIDADISAKKSEIDMLQQQLKTYEGYPDKMKEITDKIAGLNVDITDTIRNQVEMERDLWQERRAMMMDYFSAFSDVAGSMDTLIQGQMDLTNASFDNEVWNNEESTASAEEKENKLYDIEMRRYEALKENFELQKKMKEAQAWIDFASGSVGIWTAPGITSLAPFGYILAGIQQAALLASTIGSVNSIRAQQLDKPHKPNSSGGAGGAGSAGMNIALNPSSSALTSSEDRLNANIQNSTKDQPTNVVRVTDINDTQRVVRVRQENSQF